MALPRPPRSSGPVRIAMWSGPRTISTAMMRAWGNRPDTAVVDEPFYAYYLSRTGRDHPGRAEVLRSQPTDWAAVLRRVTRAPLPAGISIEYQKHMAHHLLPEVDRGPLRELRHAFLIRDPAELVASYARVREEPALDDLGLPQQLALYERFGGPVIDSRDVLRAPEPALRILCAALDVPFDAAMLGWPPGPRPTDGVWAAHWYARAWSSTGFEAPPAEAVRLPGHYRELAQRCRPYYRALAAHRLPVPEADRQRTGEGRGPRRGRGTAPPTASRRE